MDSDDLVYSTAHGTMCPSCKRPKQACTCRRASSTARPGGPVRVSRQTKGRKGKGVTLVTGLPLADEDLRSLAGELKRQCGTGGTVKDGVIEIQGDSRDRVVQELNRRGYAAKRAGG